MTIVLFVPPFSPGHIGRQPLDCWPLSQVCLAGEIGALRPDLAVEILDAEGRGLGLEEALQGVLARGPQGVLLGGSGCRFGAMIAAARWLGAAAPELSCGVWGELPRLCGKRILERVPGLRCATFDGSPRSAARLLDWSLREEADPSLLPPYTSALLPGGALAGGPASAEATSAEATVEEAPPAWNLLSPEGPAHIARAPLPVPVWRRLPGGRRRPRSPEAILADLSEVVRRFEIRGLRLVEGWVNDDPPWFAGLLERIGAEFAGEHLEITAQVRPQGRECGEEFLERAGASGVCTALALAVDTSRALRRALARTAALVARLHQRGLRAEVDLEIGGPHADLEHLDAAMAAALDLPLDAVRFFPSTWPRDPYAQPAADPFLGELGKVSAVFERGLALVRRRRTGREAQAPRARERVLALEGRARDLGCTRFARRLKESFMPSEKSDGSAGRADVERTLLWSAPLFDPSGYAEDARTLMHAAEEAGLHIRANELRWSELKMPMRPQTHARLQRLITTPLRGEVIHLCHTFPMFFQRAKGAVRNIGRTMFETDRIPAQWAAKCREMDEVWVASMFNVETFASSGVPAEKLRVLPMALDEELYSQLAEPTDLGLGSEFKFLSIFDFSLRKGWDLLLAAWCREFTRADDVCLVLKVHSSAGKSMIAIKEEMLRYVKEKLHLDPGTIPRIEFLHQLVRPEEMPALYRAADAFVVPTRGEGYGRTYMEAMACGLPVIATRWSGHMDYLHEANSYLIDYALTSVSGEAVAEAPLFRGHRWAEPVVLHLQELLRRVYTRREEARAVGARAREEVLRRFNRRVIGERIRALVEGRCEAPRRDPSDSASKPIEVGAGARPAPSLGRPVRVQWEGAFFNHHSLAKINRELAFRLNEDPDLELRCTEFEERSFRPELCGSDGVRLARTMSKRHRAADVAIVHRWPPRLEAPPSGRWVWIQPWEFGSLPVSWMEPLRRDVAEIWAPSSYVRQQYIAAGVDPRRVVVIPNGVDTSLYLPGAGPYSLPSSKGFRFLFVGGTIWRKGIDVLLTAYTAAFSARDDVTLVIKDVGARSFYQGRTYQERIQQIQDQSGAPEIIYLDEEMSEQEIAALYDTCHVLVHPYRGEGFGMPILEAMACGLPTVVTRGGASDDFCDESTSYLVGAERRTIRMGTVPTVGEPWVLEPDIGELIQLLPRVVGDLRGRERRSKAARARAEGYAWERVAERVVDRCRLLATGSEDAGGSGGEEAVATVAPGEGSWTECIARVAADEGAIWLAIASSGGEESWLERLREARGSADACVIHGCAHTLLLARRTVLRPHLQEPTQLESGAALLEIAERLEEAGELVSWIEEEQKSPASEEGYEREYRIWREYHEGVVAVRAGCIEEGFERLVRCLQEKGDFEPALFAASATLIGLGEVEAARDPVAILVGRKPNSCAVRTLQGRLLCAAGEEDAAREALLAALELEPASLPALNDLMVVEWRRGDRKAALERLKEAAEIDAMDADTLRNGADIFHALGMHERAREWLQRYLSLRPDDSEALAQLESWSATLPRP